MVRKMMTKEVTKTTVQLAKMELVDGTPTAISLPDEILLGNVNLEKAQKEVNKKYDHPVTVFNITPDTTIYEMPVEDFIAFATVKETPEQEEIQFDNQ